jgi:hypothetical protein
MLMLMVARGALTAALPAVAQRRVLGAFAAFARSARRGAGERRTTADIWDGRHDVGQEGGVGGWGEGVCRCRTREGTGCRRGVFFSYKRVRITRSRPIYMNL